MGPDQQPKMVVFGDIKFTQVSASSPVQIGVNVTFLPPTEQEANALRSLQISTFGVSSTEQEPSAMCESAGPVWNPPSLPIVEGDLTIFQPIGGRVFMQLQSNSLKLFGEESIIGRSVVIVDAPASQKNNVKLPPQFNQNLRKVACGTIGLMP